MNHKARLSEYENGGGGTGNHKGNNLLEVLGVDLAITLRRRLLVSAISGRGRTDGTSYQTTAFRG